MTSKIIALAVALVLIFSAPIYDAASKPSNPIEFGAAGGESTVVTSVEDLEGIIANIPDINEYLGVEDMTTVYENFHSLTMVEKGFGENQIKTDAYIYVENEEGETERVKVNRETINRTSHILEIAFGANGVYYTCTGETSTSIYNWEIEIIEDGGEYNEPNILSAEKTVTSYSFDLYYAKDTILIRYNNMSVERYEAGAKDDVSYSSGLPKVDFTLVEPDMEDYDQKMEALTYEALAKCYGKWMKVDISSEGDEDVMPDYGDVENMTEEEQEQYIIDMYVEALAMEYSTTVVQSFTATHSQNMAYLKGLGNFMITGIDYFKQFGDRYFLDLDGEEARMAYLATVLPNTYGAYTLDGYISNVYFDINSSNIDLVQIVRLSPISYGSTLRVETVTTFKNIDNTAANLGNAKVSSVADVFREPFGDMFRELFASEKEEENNG